MADYRPVTIIVLLMITSPAYNIVKTQEMTHVYILHIYIIIILIFWNNTLKVLAF